MSSALLDKSKAFALSVIKVCNEIKNSKRETVLTSQLLRSGTSVGANIREAFYAHGKADFIAKLQIALKECSESEYWLELLIESGYYHDRRILDQCIEVTKLLIASLNKRKSIDFSASSSGLAVFYYAHLPCCNPVKKTAATPFHRNAAVFFTF